MIRLGDQRTFLEPFHVAVSLGGAFVSSAVPRPGCGEAVRRLALDIAEAESETNTAPNRALNDLTRKDGNGDG